ncbi:MAG: 50S ribosomal protein L18 [Alphaproteobacteria bacterium MarineAlpha5_Bin2]|jgi:large subunit ribosomal protein L18|uniref:50S ribosomal protein L18 n=1 Tax=marine metagenome TaxID=408172 RepID=A0A382AC47_9ZZZZ|nr:50S ribosomal protein L18 [Pseudomonadota bacterium]PPR55671.1 MAG: 50S ribosomal protein L18 [Alphaproteobacteria bacterium MarineAlpha5_Bin2]PPR56688.1 MAG: 50S ribosomal protein L18 [Alphaproteobacteria bacterium MarineAlpha5_Bin3]HIC42048.1 50S ribosomal protein L18 [Pelagibacterales bacterium]|tara:strand:+ start:6553 stop:6891 length:339 start_codon:yes stop_codon:yes gene_type:complete
MKNSTRQNRTRFKLKKVTDRKRLSIFKSNNHIYAQIINDEKGVTLASASSLEKSIRTENKTKKELAERIGKEIAKRSIENGIKEVAFDKGKYKYHGIIKILAEAARAEGLNF